MLRAGQHEDYEHVVLCLKTAVQQLFPLPWEAGSWYCGVGVFSGIGTSAIS